jgi:hypothetical protein
LGNPCVIPLIAPFKKIDTHIARFPARSQSFSTLLASCPSGERKAMWRQIVSISATRAAFPRRLEEGKALCSGKRQVDGIDAMSFSYEVR